MKLRTNKRKNYHQDEALQENEPGLEISSLIDVCFLLLIYFLVTTTIQPREQDLRMTVPVPGEPSPLANTPMLIELQQDGTVVVNPDDGAETYESDPSQRELPRLKERLSMLVGLGADSNQPSVVLRIHNQAVQQRYIDIINCLASVGIQNVAIQD